MQLGFGVCLAIGYAIGAPLSLASVQCSQELEPLWKVGSTLGTPAPLVASSSNNAVAALASSSSLGLVAEEVSSSLGMVGYAIGTPLEVRPLLTRGLVFVTCAATSWTQQC